MLGLIGTTGCLTGTKGKHVIESFRKGQGLENKHKVGEGGLWNIG